MLRHDFAEESGRRMTLARPKADRRKFSCGVESSGWRRRHKQTFATAPTPDVGKVNAGSKAVIGAGARSSHLATGGSCGWRRVDDRLAAHK